MIVELINTGSELLMGHTLNTHQQWLCRRLTDLGHVVSRQVAVPDTGEEICQAVRESLGRADIVITTGGLGPTSDDITREKVARLLGRSLLEDAAVTESIREFFKSRKRPIPEGVRAEAKVPEGACVFLNAYGTAPGLAVELSPNPFREGKARSWLIMLPGPPRELRPMFETSVVSFLQREAGSAEPFACASLRTTGVPESVAQRRIEERLAALQEQGLEVGYCARPGEVDIRLSARGMGAEDTVCQAADKVRDALARTIYTETEEELEAVVVRLLKERKETMAIAESCTGGLIGHRITNVPGASGVLLSDCVTYSNAAKQQLLGVDPSTLSAHGAVSEAVCAEMANGVRRVSGASFGLAVTGIAGPTGGTKEKPVGTVFIGLADRRTVQTERHYNPWPRVTFKQVTAQQALNLVRTRLLETPPR